MSRPIEDYGIIGNAYTAALVSRDGSIDWLCLPRFDSESVFAALLGEPKHGRWLLAPQDPEARCSRAYRGETGILETRFETAEGAATVIDFMPFTGRRGSDRPDPPRARRQGPRADAHRDRPALQLRARHTLGALASRRPERGRRAERGAIRHAGAAARHEGPDDAGRVHGPGRRNRAVHDELVSLAPSRLPLSRSARPSARNRERVVRLVEPLHAEGAVARGDRALADHAEDADLSADRRHRRGGDDLAAGSARRRAQLGLPVLLDPRRDADAVRAAQLRLPRPRRAPGASGCCAPSPAIRRKCRSCTASPASAG